MELLTPAEVCQMLKITRATYFRRVRPTLPVVTIGQKVRVRREDLENWVAAKAVARHAV